MTRPLIGLLALGVGALGILLAAGTHDLNWLWLIVPGVLAEGLLVPSAEGRDAAQ